MNREFKEEEVAVSQKPQVLLPPNFHLLPMKEQIRILERDKLLLFQTGGGLQIIKRKTPELQTEESSLGQDTTVKAEEAGGGCSLCKRSRLKLHELSR